MTKKWNQITEALKNGALGVKSYPILKRMLENAQKRQFIVINGEVLNIEGVNCAKRLLDESLESMEPGMLRLMKRNLIYLFLVDKLYHCLQHDFDTKTEKKIRKERFYLEAIEYWLGIVFEKLGYTLRSEKGEGLD